MLSSIKKSVNELNSIHVPTLAIALVACFFLFKTAYASWVFVQFSVAAVLAVAVIFSVLFTGLSAFYLISVTWAKPRGDYFFWLALLLSLILVLIINFSYSIQMARYAQFFPLLEMESGLGWHADTAYHVTLIHHIMSDGVPSVGLHGSPLSFYHVLSHYVDAGVLWLTGLDPLDSYGLLYSFKEFLLIAVLVVLLAVASQSVGFGFFFFSLLFFVPVAIGTWHAIGSHGLWFTSVLAISTTPWVFQVISSPSPLKHGHFLGVFLLGVVLAFGKVSSGFAFSMLMGFILLLRNPKDARVYALGAAWLLFFAAYNSIFSSSYADLSSAGATTSLAESFKIFINGLLFGYADQSVKIKILVLLVLTLLLYLKVKADYLKNMLMAGALSYVMLLALIAVTPSLGTSDTWYLLYGLSFPLLLFVYLSLARSFSGLWNGQVAQPRLIHMGRLLLVGVLLSTALMPRTHVNVFNPDIQYAFNSFWFRPFEKVAGVLGLHEGHGIDLSNRLTVSFETVPKRCLLALETELALRMKQAGLSKPDVLVFVPKEVYGSAFHRLKGNPLAYGFIVTSVTGLPLVHGLMEHRSGYGHADYDENALWRPRNELATGNACSFGKTIIVVEQLSPPQLSLHPCKPT